MRKITTQDRLRYRFDNTMSKGTVALIGWLFALSALLVIAASAVLYVLQASPAAEDGVQPSFGKLMWMGLMHALDSGAVGGDSGGWGFLLLMFVVTLGGIFVVSILIGVLTTGIEARLEELRKGRSFVVEEGHTVFLGWSPQIFSILSELVIANANRKNACIAILAPMDKVEMEDEIRSRVCPTGNTRVVCRTGSPIDPADLETVNPWGARSIIVLASEAENPDLEVIKAVLALTQQTGGGGAHCPITTEVRDPDNLEVLRMIGGDRVVAVEVGRLIARMIVQTCRQSGLSAVYTELLDFAGDEIYFAEAPALAGKTYGEALLSFAESAVLGLRCRDGRILLSPPAETRIEAGDRIVAISADDDTIRYSGIGDVKVDPAAIQERPRREPRPERTLILGWNRSGTFIINELNRYVAPGSVVTVVAPDEDAGQEIARCCGEPGNQSVEFRPGVTTDRATLEALDVPSYDQVVVLSYSDALPPQEADGRTLVTLLHLRAIAERSTRDFSIVSEMMDSRNRELAAVTHADDFIVSNKLVSLLLAQLSENRELAPVFEDLFDPEGVEVYLKPAGDYVALGRPVTFYTVVESARRRGETAFGYRLSGQAADANGSYGVHCNPDKRALVTFGEGDRIIVLADS